MKGKSSIHIVTVGDYNDHAVSIHLGRPAESVPEGGHDATTEIKIESGKVKLSSPAYVSDEEPVFHVGSGVFELTIRSLNPGKEDPDAAEELEDRDFFKLAHLERYELYFAPKA